MDHGTNVSLNRILFNSKEKTELHTRKLSRHCEQINVTNLRSQFRKKYGNKYKQECVYRDLSKIEKQVTLLSSCTGKDDYLKKMLPENPDNKTILNQKSASIDIGSQCHTVTTRESIEQVKYDINIDSSQNILSLSQEQMFLNKKTFPQLTQNSTKMTFNLNKLLDEDKASARDNVNFLIPFTEASANKRNDNMIGGNDNDDSDNEDDCNSKMQKSKKAYTAFEFDGDSSGLFEFSLEGEKLVSSLCGPQSKVGRKEDGLQNNKLLMYNKSNHELNYPDTFKSNVPDKGKGNNSFLSKHMDIGMSFSNAVTSTPEKDHSNSIHEYHLHHEMKSASKSREENKIITEAEHSINKLSGSDELSLDNNSNESKSVITNLSCASRVEKSPVLSIDSGMYGHIKQAQTKECTNSIDLCSLFQGNILHENLGNNIKKCAESSKSEDINKANKSASVPNLFSMINKFNQGKTFSIASNIESQIHNENEVKNETVPDSCDDEISFRKSAIKGCLVFERIIKDLHITTYQDLENYCKTVKRCVSVANTIDSREFTALISELIFSFLKLADSWGILNSYFGESGNSEFKPQNLDDINLYQSFQDWQVKSKTLLDHLTIVVQNLKESLPKAVEKELKVVPEPQTKFPQYNPFFSQPQVKSSSIASLNKCGNNPTFPVQPIQKEENLNYQMPSPFQTQEIQFPKNIANIFSAHNQNNNWKPAISDNGQKKSEIYWEIPQTSQQNVFNMQPMAERKQRKKWTITMPDFQNETPCPLVTSQGMAMQQTQASGPLPSVNFQYVTQNKNPVENLMMQPINFFGNQYNTVSQNMQSIQNIRENTTAAFNYCRPQTLYTNLKQSPKRKGNSNFKPEEQFHKDVINSNAMYNRVNICNPQMPIPLLQNNVNPNPFGMMDEAKTNVIYQNFCIGDGKTLPPANTAYGTPFIQNEIYSTNPIANQNQFCHKNCEPKTLLPVPLANCDGDDSSEEYYPVKSYMKPGSYRVPNKSKSLVLQSTNNLNYIFDDVIVTGITVPFTKSNIFSQSKKNCQKTVNTIEKSIQTNRSDEVKHTDLVWKAALASAEEFGKSLICKQDEQNQTSKPNSPCQDKGATKVQENALEENCKSCGDSQSLDAPTIHISTQNKEEKHIDLEVAKSGSVKTDDWLIQSLSKLEGQPESKDPSLMESSKKSETESSSMKTSDSKSKTSNTKSNESDESDNTTNDIDSECYVAKDKGISQKKDKCNGMKQKLTPNLKSVSILQKPREYCQSRTKPWDKAREYSYQTPYKGDSRNMHKNPTNWIKYNRKCINRQTLLKLQDILNSLSKMETSNGEQKESVNNHEHINKIINVNAVNYKLKSHIYENIDQILIDIRQMFINGRDANKECCKTIDLITKLEICFDELVEKHFGQPDSSDNRETNQNGSPLAMKHRRAHKVQRKLN